MVISSNAKVVRSNILPMGLAAPISIFQGWHVRVIHAKGSKPGGW